MSSITVIGSVALDTIETASAKVEAILGGSATYFSISASFFTKVNIVATVGEDFPKKYRSLIGSFGVDTLGLETKQGETFRWTGSYIDDMNCAKTIETQLNVFKDFAPLVPEDYKKSKFIFLANIDPDLQVHVLRNIGKGKVIGCDSMNYWILNKKPSLEALMKKVDIMFMNDTESRLFSGESNILKAGRAIIASGPKYLIIKRGEYGAMLFIGKDVVLNIPVVLLENVVDPTGAGDAFAGGFMGYLARKDKLDPISAKQALIHGTVLASYAVEDFSVRRFVGLKKKDIVNRHVAFKKMISP